MKKRELKAKIAELEQSVHTWKAAFLDTSKELTRVQMVLQSIPRPVEQDAPLAAVATQAVNFDLRDKPASRADKEDLYRDGLACGLSSEAAWERAKMGVEAWNAKDRAEFKASLEESGVFDAAATKFQADSVTEGNISTELINRYFQSDNPLERPDWVVRALQEAVPLVQWRGRVGNVRDLDGEFMFEMLAPNRFKITYRWLDLGEFNHVSGKGFEKA